jgi:hypothetical protein
MLVKRLHYIASGTDDAQIHCNTICLGGKFLGGHSKFLAKPFSLLRRQHTQQAKISTIALFFDVNATGEIVISFADEKLSGAQILMDAFEVNSITFNGNALDNKSFVDELLKGSSVGYSCNTNRVWSSEKTQEKIERPGNFAAAPSSSSMRRS